MNLRENIWLKCGEHDDHGPPRGDAAAHNTNQT